MINISEDNKTHLQRFKNEPPNASYIAGFIDGDGCIFIRKIKDGYQSGIQITQCRTNILQVIRYHFGGNIISNNNRNNNITNKIDNTTNNIHKYNNRNQYTLVIRSNEYQYILDYIKYNLIIKYNQINCLCNFNKLVNLQNKKNEKENLYIECSSLNNKTAKRELQLSNLNIGYIAGLFDAEGCFYIEKNCKDHRISICQKSYPEVLYKIQELLGLGSISCNEKFVIYNKNDCLYFINLIKPYLIVKYNQAVAFEKYLTTNDIKIKEFMYSICNQEKHNIEYFTDLNINNDGKEMFLEKNKFVSCKNNMLKELLTTTNTKLKSVINKKTKTEHHHFGKTFSEETRKKMSNSIRDAKEGVSDDIIIQVRNLIHEGLKNIEIQELLKLPRHTVTKIKNGMLVCRSEIRVKKETLTKEQQNINKRKIKLEEILITIDMTINNKTPMEILDYLVEKRNCNNIQNNLTIDIIKNIKRNLTNGKQVIYESELSKEKYEYYNQLVNIFAKK